MNQNPWHALMTWVDARIAEKLRDIGVYGTTIDAGHIGGQLPPGTVGAIPIDALSDVDTTTVAPVAGDALLFDGTNWVPGEGGAATTRWEPLTNGLAEVPELVFAGGEVVMCEVPL